MALSPRTLRLFDEHGLTGCVSALAAAGFRSLCDVRELRLSEADLAACGVSRLLDRRRILVLAEGFDASEAPPPRHPASVAFGTLQPLGSRANAGGRSASAGSNSGSDGGGPPRGHAASTAVPSVPSPRDEGDAIGDAGAGAAADRAPSGAQRSDCGAWPLRSLLPAHPPPGVLQSAVEADVAAFALLSPPSQRRLGGDHVEVTVFAARGGTTGSASDTRLASRDHYCKVCLCELVGGRVEAVPGTEHRTPMAPGPAPVFATPGGTPRGGCVFRVPTNFAPSSKCVALELKENRLLQENRTRGAFVWPLEWLASFGPSDEWEGWVALPSPFPTPGRPTTAGASTEAPPSVFPAVRVRLRVPGGAPTQRSKGAWVAAVSMARRALLVCVGSVVLTPAAHARLARCEGGGSAGRSPPALFVTATIVASGAAAAAVHSGVTPPDAALARATRVAAPSFELLAFDETFEFRGEASAAKVLVVELREACATTVPALASTTRSRPVSPAAEPAPTLTRRASVVSSPASPPSSVVLGAVYIPIQFYLTRPEATDIDARYALRWPVDGSGSDAGDGDEGVVARVRLRLGVRETGAAPAPPPVQAVAREAPALLSGAATQRDCGQDMLL